MSNNKKNIFKLRLKRSLNFAIASIRRAPSEVLGVVSSLSISLVFLSAFIMITLLADTTLAILSNKLDLPIEIKQEAEINRVQLAKEQLENHEMIKEVKYVSPDDNIDNFTKKFPDLAESLKTYGFDTPLPAMFFVLPKRNSDINKILNSFDNKNWEDVLDFSIIKQGDIMGPISNLSKIANVIEIGIGIIALFSLVTSIFSGYAATRTALFARNKEIKLMRIIGADISFIRMPFIIEGIILGLFSSLITILIFGLLSSIISIGMHSWFSGAILAFDQSNILHFILPLSADNLIKWFFINSPFILFLYIIVSCSVGGISSLMATKN